MSTATAGHTVQVGDFFYSSWGYDQTNVDFYKVVGVTAKGVKIQQWRTRPVSADDYSARLVPGDGPHTSPCWIDGVMVGEVAAPVQQKRVQQSDYDGRLRLAWRSYADLYFWDGDPRYQTDPRAGH